MDLGLPGAAGSSFFGGGEQGGSEFLVEGEEVFDALAVVVEGLRTVAEVNGPVKRGVSFDERGRHGERVVEVGERGVGKLLARVEDGLRGRFDGVALRGTSYPCVICAGGSRSTYLTFGVLANSG